MPIISTIILVFIALALAYTYWSMIRGLVKEHQLSWPLAALVVVIFLGLIGAVFTMLYLLIVAGPVNAGSLLGMIFGISLILAGIRTFTR
jgi:uncharacterized membrane protein HdeD (DUF308 family)